MGQSGTVLAGTILVCMSEFSIRVCSVCNADRSSHGPVIPEKKDVRQAYVYPISACAQSGA